MGKATGFLEYTRCESSAKEPLERIKDYNRITIGTREQIDSLISAIERIWG